VSKSSETLALQGLYSLSDKLTLLSGPNFIPKEAFELFSLANK